MPRVRFKKGKQRDFLLEARKVVGDRTEHLAEVCSVNPRTVRDWMREKYLISQLVVEAIENKLNIKSPKAVEVLPDHWSTSKAGKIGGKSRYKLYGSPGTKEGRKKGGRISCRLQQETAKKGITTGFVVRKSVRFPKENVKLAEAVGIILGDGHISRFQVLIHTSALVDRKYADYIDRLFRDLFKVGVCRRKIRRNTITLVVSSREIVEFFNRMGLKSGDKIRNDVCIPKWILEKNPYVRACVRGLFDTDGCIYYHRHSTRGREYNDVGWEFRNLNENLLNEVHRFLLKKGFKSKKKVGRVSLYNRANIRRFMEEIGTSNPKHKTRYVNYFKELGGMTERP